MKIFPKLQWNDKYMVNDRRRFILAATSSVRPIIRGRFDLRRFNLGRFTRGVFILYPSPDDPKWVYVFLMYEFRRSLNSVFFSSRFYVKNWLQEAHTKAHGCISLPLSRLQQRLLRSLHSSRTFECP